MKLEDQVVSLPLARRLKELGVKQESLFYFCQCHEAVFQEEDLCLHVGDPHPHRLSAYTVAELGKLIGQDYFTVKTGAGNYQCFKLDVIRCSVIGETLINIPSETTEVNARGELLIYLIEQGLVKP